MFRRRRYRISSYCLVFSETVGNAVIKFCHRFLKSVHVYISSEVEISSTSSKYWSVCDCSIVIPPKTLLLLQISYWGVILLCTVTNTWKNTNTLYQKPVRTLNYLVSMPSARAIKARNRKYYKNNAESITSHSRDNYKTNPQNKMAASRDFSKARYSADLQKARAAARELYSTN